MARMASSVSVCLRSATELAAAAAKTCAVAYMTWRRASAYRSTSCQIASNAATAIPAVTAAATCKTSFRTNDGRRIVNFSKINQH